MGLVHGILRALFPPSAEPIDDLIRGRQAIVRGRVVARDCLESPLTGVSCVYYSYSVEEWRESRMAGLPEGFWNLAESDEAIAEFYLQDQTGRRAIVSPHGARVERGRGLQPRPVDLGTSLRRARELAIHSGDYIEVAAVADQVEDLYDEARDYRSRASRWLLRAPDNGHVVIKLLARASEATTAVLGERLSAG